MLIQLQRELRLNNLFYRKAWEKYFRSKGICSHSMHPFIMLEDWYKKEHEKRMIALQEYLYSNYPELKGLCQKKRK